MMFLRLIGMIVIIEALFFALLTIYFRSLHREHLEKEWDREHPDEAGNTPERREFVREAMLGFGKTLRARLIVWVMVLPFIAIMTIIYFVNYH